jgi:Holliday junction resolvase RusA-like endonuclease
MQDFFIPVRMPNLNDYIDELNAHRQAGAAMKKEWTELTAEYAKAARLGHFTEPITLEFHWYEPNTKRDQDNVAFAKKFILDGLKLHGVITDDSYKWVKGFSDHFHYEDKAGVHIVMKEIEDDRRTIVMDGTRK